MKFKKLEIHNIASIEHAIIDFETEPLAGSEVFLITGKTGAGKSTILDAICLALYNNTPRLADSHNTTKDLKDLVNEKDGLHINSTSQLLRRNAGEGWAILAFKGSDGIDYEAKWHVSRAYGKPDKKIQPVVRTIKNLETGKSTSAVKDIDALVESKAVGLTFEQFCRTTMLAQGEFTKFLKSNEKDKSAILENITGADIYHRIGMKINQLYKEKKNNYDQLCEKAEGKQGLTEEELALKNEEITRNDEELAQLTAQKTSLDNKVKWLNNDAELISKQQKAQEELTMAQAKMDSEEVKRDSSLVSQWNATRDARGWLKQKKDAEQNVNRTAGELEGLSIKYASLKGGYAAQQKATEEMKAKAAQITVAINMQADKAEVFSQHQAIEILLQNVIDEQACIAREQNKQKELKQRLDGELMQAKKLAVERHQQQKDKVEGKRADVKKKEEDFNQINLQALNDKKIKLVERGHDLETAVKSLNDVDKARKDRNNESAYLDNLKASIAELEKQVTDLTQKVQDADVTRKDLKRVFELIEAQTQSWAKTLRGKLKKDDVCPVCFQKISSEIHDDGFVNDIYDQARKNADDAENTYEYLSKQLNKASSDRKVLQDSYTKRQENFDNDRSLEEAEGKVKEALSIVGIDIENADAALNEQIGRNKEEKAELQKKIEEGNNLQAALSNARKDLEKEEKKLDRLKKNLDAADKELTDCKSKIATSQELLESHLKACQEKEKEVDCALEGTGSWASEWKKEPTEFKTKLHAEAKAYEKLKDDSRDLTNDISNAENMLGRVEENFNDILQKCPGWRLVLPKAEVMAQKLETKVNDLSQKVTEMVTNLNMYQQNVITYQDHVENFLAGHADFTVSQLADLSSLTQETIDRKDRSVNDARNDLNSKLTLVESARKAYEEHKQERPDMQEEVSIETLASQITELDTRKNVLQQQQGAIKQQLKDDEKLKKERESLLKKTEVALKEQNRWERLNKYFGDAEGKKFRTIAQSYVLAQLIQSANEYMTHLTDRYSLYIKPGSFAVYMEDAYQGYVRRPASTISGGESFLVSLALALALSDIDQKQSADILFIDEGFGTLSGEPLAKAIETLRTLHSTSGRRVGIISHIDELREKLPVQIHVDQSSYNSKSTIAIVGE